MRTSLIHIDFLKAAARFSISTLLTVLPALSAGEVQAQDSTGSTPVCSGDSILTASPKKQNPISKLINYFETANKTVLTRRPSFSFIGGPHYSSDTGFGVGLVAEGLYSTDPADTLLLPSNISMTADLTTSLYFKVGVSGIHLYPHADRRMDYDVNFVSYKTYFWGIGTSKARSASNKTKYLLLDFTAEGDFLWKTWDKLYIGPAASFNYISARKREDAELWEGEPRRFVATAAGLRMEFDTRDNFTAPKSGWRCSLTQKVFPKWLGNSSHHFAETDIDLNRYSTLWKGGVLAVKVHGDFTYGNTPWGLLPSLGGSSTMRGYYDGQYRDKCETDATVELRQHIMGRSGIVAWGGAGAVFRNFRSFNSNDLLPSYGIGYRWEFKRNCNVRVDVGFGRSCWGVVFNINEAF